MSNLNIYFIIDRIRTQGPSQGFASMRWDEATDNSSTFVLDFPLIFPDIDEDTVRDTATRICHAEKVAVRIIGKRRHFT